MPLFEYKAVAPTGETVQGTMEAVSLDSVVAKLQEAGNIPLQAKEAGKGLLRLMRSDGFAAPDRELLARTTKAYDRRPAKEKQGKEKGARKGKGKGKGKRQRQP